MTPAQSTSSSKENGGDDDDTFGKHIFTFSTVEVDLKIFILTDDGLTVDGVYYASVEAYMASEGSVPPPPLLRKEPPPPSVTVWATTSSSSGRKRLTPTTSARVPLRTVSASATSIRPRIISYHE